MSRNNTLNLGRHSIRTLTPTDLRAVHGGYASGGRGDARDAK